MLQHLTAPAPTSPRRHTRVLACLTAGVVLGHWTLLQAAPTSLGAPSDTASPAATAFITRTITPEPVPTAPPAPALSPVHRPKPVAQKKQENRPFAQSSIESIATEAIAPTHPVGVQVAAADTAPVTTRAEVPNVLTSAPKFAIPAPARLLYEVKGIVGGTSYTGNGELLWQHDGKAYEARLALSKFLIPLRVQTSKGQLTPQGVEPTRFGDKRGSEVAAHFERNLSKIVFSANTPDAPLQPGAQDHLSVFIQLGALLGAEPSRYPAGSTLAFQAVGSHYAEQWAFVLGSLEKQTLPGGDMNAIKLTRDAMHERDSKVETWLAPDAGYLPVHIRLSQPNGDFVDMLWSSTQKP